MTKRTKYIGEPETYLRVEWWLSDDIRGVIAMRNTVDDLKMLCDPSINWKYNPEANEWSDGYFTIAPFYLQGEIG